MTNPSAIDKLRDELRQDHVVTPYYEQAEAPEMIEIFWGAQSLFRPLFEKLDLTAVTELACGHGRHSAQIEAKAGDMTLVDIVADNIAACRKRFAKRKNVAYVVNNGRDLSAIKSDSQTAVFSYDAMVHFELGDVLTYLPEIARVLKPGGRMLLHYSTNDADPTASYRDHPRWRNFGSEKTVLHFAHRAGLVVIDRFETSWPPGNGETAIDGVVLAEKR